MNGNVPDSIREHARRRGAHPALRVETPSATRTVSYAELARIMDSEATRLREEGVKPGDRCGLIARQGPEFILKAVSILAAGACLVPVPDEYAGPARPVFERGARLHRWLIESEGFVPKPGLLDPAPDPDVEAAFRALEPAYLRFTSGTTGERKGVILSHRRIAERLDAAQAGLQIRPEDRILWLLPMAHHFVVSILLYLRHGSTVLLPASSLARPILEFAARERATVLYASPFHFHLLSQDASSIRLDSVRLAISTTDALRPEIAADFQERFGRPLCQALGIIEVGLPVVNLAEAETKPLALGRPLPAYDVWLRDDDGEPVVGPGSPERTGEICVRGPGLFDAYFSPWTPSENVVEPDGFRTGDQGWFDADGTLHLAGRRQNRINFAGLKFFAEEVEQVIARHPGVRECRVRPQHHPRLGSIPVADLVPSDAGRAETLRVEVLSLCRAELPSYKIPRRFQLVSELEHTVTGKLQR